jgi:hypothetical protein
MPASLYPAALDDDSSLYSITNDFATLLTAGINAGATTIPVASTAGLPPIGVVSIDTEIIYYTGTTGTSLTGCTRGYDSSAAEAHAIGTRVELRIVADHHNSLAAAIKTIETALGINPFGTFANVAALLANITPGIVLVNAPTTNWTFTHLRKRIVGVQLWQKTGTNIYTRFDNAMSQLVDPLSVSTVTITLGSAQQGYIIYN